MKRSMVNRRSLFLAAAVASPLLQHTAPAATKFWQNSLTGTWSNGSLWSPNGMPTSGDTVAIGASLFAQNGQCMIDVDAIVSGLSITDGMFVDDRFNSITVNGDTVVSGDNNASGGNVTQFWLRSSSLNPYELFTHNLTVSDGAYLRLIGLPRVHATGAMVVDGASQMYGAGIINFTSNTGTALVLDGHISIDANSTLELNQLGSARIDLDGGVAGDRTIVTSYYDQRFTVNGDQLTDAFDDTFWIGNSGRIEMNLSNGWTLGNAGKIVFLDDNTGGLARLTGGTMTVAGQISSLVPPGYEVHASIEAPVILNPTGSVVLGEFDNMDFTSNVTTIGGLMQLDRFARLNFAGPATINGGTIKALELGGEVTFDGATVVNGGQFEVGHWNGSADFASGEVIFNGSTTVNGGTFNMVDEGWVTFNGPTKIFGGTFNTVNTDPTDGRVLFAGATEFKNTITINGVGRQNGAATVNAPATINADLFDLDGELSITNWSINAPLTLNVGAVNVGNNTFTGVLNLTSTTSSPAKLAVNLPAGDSWIMSGLMNMVGTGIGTSTDVISGSDVTISGPVKVSFDNAISARATFSSTNVSTINTASSLRLDGGTLANPNRLNGGTIKGAGTLKSSFGRGLWGFGTISTTVAFATGELRADGGVLNLNGPISSVGVIAAQPGGTLKFGQPFNTSVATRLEVNGGNVTGSSVTNAAGREVRGFGAILTAGLNNSGTLNVTGGTLAVDTTGSPDLDGSAETGKLTIAAGSKLYFADAPSDDFNGTASVAAGATLQFEQTWAHGDGAFLSLNGTAAQPATVAAAGQTIKGNVIMPANARATFNAPTTFASTAGVVINPGAQLDVIQHSTVSAGALFSGGGTLRNGPGATMKLAHGAEVSVNLLNAGNLEVGTQFFGIAAAGGFTQTNNANLKIDLFGATPGTLFDRLEVNATASLAGSLTLSHGLYNPQYLVSHEIISAAGVSGVFSGVAGVVVSPMKYLAVTYDADSVFVTAAIPGDANLSGTVNIDDFAILASNFNLNATWATGNFNGDMKTDIDDFGLLATNFNTGVPGGLASRGSAVPEPATLGLLTLCGLLPRKRVRS